MFTTAGACLFVASEQFGDPLTVVRFPGRYNSLQWNRRAKPEPQQGKSVMPLVIRTLTILLLAFSAAPLLADDKDEIRSVIPQATAMQKADFDKITKESASPEAIKDRSFTLQVALLKFNDKRSKEQLLEFKWLNERLKPTDLANEWNGSVRLGNLAIPLKPVTAVHGNRITAITCDVKGDQATGEFSFRVPKLYEGTANYIAARQDGKWQITDLKLPAHKIHLVRGEDGLWSEN